MHNLSILADQSKLLPGHRPAGPKCFGFILAITLIATGGCSDDGGGGPPDRLADVTTTLDEGSVSDQLPKGELSPELLPALVATDDIRAGTSAAAALDEGTLEIQIVNIEDFPEDAIVSPDLVETAQLNQFVTAGTVLRAAMFDSLPPSFEGE